MLDYLTIMEFLDIIYKISAPVLALTTILLTFHIHKLSAENTKTDKFLQYIIDLYYRIEDDSCLLLEQCALTNTNDENILKQCVRRISVNCTLMVYYLKRFPGYYKDRDEFEQSLVQIISEPTKEDNYNNLSYQFEKFCWGVRRNKKSANHYLLDINKKGYPDENRV